MTEKNNSIDQMADEIKKVVESRIQNQIKQLEKQIEDLRNNKEKNFLESELSFDNKITCNILNCVDRASIDKSYSEETRKYFRKIRNDYIELLSKSMERHSDRGSFSGPSREALDFSSSLDSTMEHITKNKPSEINNFIALIILRMFAVNLIPGISRANHFYQQFAVHLKGEFV